MPLQQETRATVKRERKRERKKERERTKMNFIIYFILGEGLEGEVSMSAVAANMKNLCVDLERVDMYIFFINHCIYLIY